MWREPLREEIVSLVGGKAHGPRGLLLSPGDINNRLSSLNYSQKPVTTHPH